MFNLATFFQTSNSETVHKKIKSSSAQRLKIFFFQSKMKLSVYIERI